MFKEKHAYLAALALAVMLSQVYGFPQKSDPFAEYKRDFWWLIENDEQASDYIFYDEPLDASVTTVYKTKDGKAVALVTRNPSDQIINCQIYGSVNFNDKVIARSPTEPLIVSAEEFTSLRNDCQETQLKNLHKLVENINEDILYDAYPDGANQDFGPFTIFEGIYPGTLWCGSGNIADTVNSADGLGEFKATDACCREHDHCPTSVCGKCTKFGLENSSPWTRSDCKCDKKFKACLDKAGSIDPISSGVVKTAYFTFLRIKCLLYDYPKSNRCASYKTFLELICDMYEKDTSKPKVYLWSQA